MITELADHRTGQHYGYELQNITPGTGRTINQHFGFYRNYQNLGSGNAVQLHAHLRMGACSGSVFGNPCFSLGGDTTIRGVGRDALEGDVFVLSNVQLLIPMAKARNISGVLFFWMPGAVTDSMSKGHTTPVRGWSWSGLGVETKKFC